MRPSILAIFLFFIIIVFFELYFIQAVKTVSIDYSPSRRKFILWFTYILAFCSILLFAVSAVYPPPEWNSSMRFVAAIFLILLLCKVVGCIFLLMDDLVRLVRWVIVKFSSKHQAVNAEDTSNHISRLKFFSYLALTFSVIPAVSFIYGMIRGAYKYRVHKVKVESPNLPEAFDGFKIVQISDMHCGSFMSTDPLVKAFNIVMEQSADMILFTGDLVNNETIETQPHLDTFKILKAPHGVYSTLGNHDYGDYKQWETTEDKARNLEDLKNVYANSGWRLLMNEHVPIEKNGQKIALLGVENWGGNLRFPRYGKLENAHAGTEGYPFKILLSHDPSHWDKQVSQEKIYSDIDLTLSGHTHGMQFGIDIPGLKWSPVQYVYKHWAGLYKQDHQYLYVNRGLGFLGYPGRLGIWPEITVIELKKA